MPPDFGDHFVPGRSIIQEHTKNAIWNQTLQNANPFVAAHDLLGEKGILNAGVRVNARAELYQISGLKLVVYVYNLWQWRVITPVLQNNGESLLPCYKKWKNVNFAKINWRLLKRGFSFVNFGFRWRFFSLNAVLYVLTRSAWNKMIAKFRRHYIPIWSLEATHCAKLVKSRLSKSQIYVFDKRDQIRRNKNFELISVFEPSMVPNCWIENDVHVCRVILLCCCIGWSGSESNSWVLEKQE